MNHSALANKMTSDIRQKRNTLFQLVDFYTLFYFRFIRHNKYQDSGFWSSSQNSQLYHTWAGLSFEMFLSKPYRQNQSSRPGNFGKYRPWFAHGEAATQKRERKYDLLIDRKDETINICEMKFYKSEFEISKEYEEKCQEKLRTFTEETRTSKSLLLTLITSFGFKAEQT